jgi:hypothetical protein
VPPTVRPARARRSSVAVGMGGHDRAAMLIPATRTDVTCYSGLGDGGCDTAGVSPHTHAGIAGPRNAELTALTFMSGGILAAGRSGSGIALDDVGLPTWGRGFETRGVASIEGVALAANRNSSANLDALAKRRPVLANDGHCVALLRAPGNVGHVCMTSGHRTRRCCSRAADSPRRPGPHIGRWRRLLNQVFSPSRHSSRARQVGSRHNPGGAML